jgi:hypothetical protein
MRNLFWRKGTTVFRIEQTIASVLRATFSSRLLAHVCVREIHNLEICFSRCRFSDTLELDDAIHTAILTLKEGIEGQLSADSFEIGVITMDRAIGVGVDSPHAQPQGTMSFRKLLPSQVKDYLENIA